MLINKRLYERIIKKRGELDKLKHLSKSAIERLKKEIEIEWTYNSNAIEGNTLTLRETRLVLEQGVTIGGKSLKEHLEAINHKEAIEFVETLVKPKKRITEFVVRQIHEIILKGIDEKERGRYRKKKVRIGGAIFAPAEPYKIQELMEDFEKWLNKNPDRLNPIELAAVAHHKLAYIHPFIDVNGRVARLLTNLILMKYGFPPIVLLNVERKKYYKALMEADRGNLVPFVNFIAKAVERSLSLYLNALKPTKEEEYISLKEASKLCPYSQEYLSLLARKGRLEAIKLGRNWVTTRKAIKEYLRSIKR